MAVDLPRGRAICYSGYREGQSPDSRAYPSPAEIREDLHLLASHWQLLRLYDCSPHAERVLQVIREDRLPLRVMLGAWLGAEASNPACPWGGLHPEERLEANRRQNEAELDRLIRLARDHADTVFAVAVGNEATVDWTDHLVPPPRMLEHVRRVRAARLPQPVTVCDNHVPWRHALREVADELDFVSLHSYPQWEHASIDEALARTQADVAAVARAHPGKPVVITEAGWCTASDDRTMPAPQASEELQARHVPELLAWAHSEGLLCFVFEAFDEPWKGSSNPLEPEKHWGLYTADRRPKPAMRELLAARSGAPHATAPVDA